MAHLLNSTPTVHLDGKSIEPAQGVSDSHDLGTASSDGANCAWQRLVERRPAGASIKRRAGVEQRGPTASAAKSSGMCFSIPWLATPLWCFGRLDMHHAHVPEDQAVVRVRRPRVCPVRRQLRATRRTSLVRADPGRAYRSRQVAQIRRTGWLHCRRPAHRTSVQRVG